VRLGRVAWVVLLAACHHGAAATDGPRGGSSSGRDATIDAALACGSASMVVAGTASPGSWATTKAAAAPVNELASEYQAPVAQPLANLAWEDGIYITRDGLSLYAYYEPMDYLTVVTHAVTPDVFYEYERGNLIGQDFSNPENEPHPWIHADVAVAQRASVSDAFCHWSLSELAGKYYNLGGPVGVLDATDASMFDLFAYTDDSSGSGRLGLLRNVGRDLAPAGTPFPANISATGTKQDNPHIERYDAADPNQIVLFFSSDAGGAAGSTNIWYATSSDGAMTWTDPVSVSTVNTSTSQDQPHLYNDGTQWWLYFTTLNPSDSKPGIFRAAQGTPGDWNSWQTKQLVVSAGNTGGVGEPTLTAAGDLSFAVITQNTTGGTTTDQFDADPWLMKKN
jgi:hypothetical protein